MIFGASSVIWSILLNFSGGKIFFPRKSSSLASIIFNMELPKKITDRSNAKPSLSKSRQLFPFSLHQTAQVFLSVIDISIVDGNFLATAKSRNPYFPDKNSSMFFLGKNI